MMTSGQPALLYLWITFTVMAAIGISAVLFWAVRSRQFSNQDRARWLPLWSGVPETGRAPAPALRVLQRERDDEEGDSHAAL